MRALRVSPLSLRLFSYLIVWSVEKLKNKLYGMRDLYEQSVVEGSSSRVKFSVHFRKTFM